MVVFGTVLLDPLQTGEHNDNILGPINNQYVVAILRVDIDDTDVHPRRFEMITTFK